VQLHIMLLLSIMRPELGRINLSQHQQIDRCFSTSCRQRVKIGHVGIM
jgi:hypothetical protein